MLNVPLAKILVQPDVVPAPEGLIDRLAVVTRKSLRQVSTAVQFRRLADTGDTQRLDEYMWRQQDQCLDAGTALAAGMNQCDRSAITVADQNGRLNVKGVQYLWQRLLGLIMHIVTTPRQHRGI